MVNFSIRVEKEPEKIPVFFCKKNVDRKISELYSIFRKNKET